MAASTKTMSTVESSDEEAEFFEDVEAFGVQPYMFEPEFDEEELESGEIDSDSDQSTGDEREVDEMRVGNTDWCTCGMCGAMSTGRESRCCQELAVLESKRVEEGTDEETPCITGHRDFIAFTQRVVLENTLLLLMNVRNNPVDITLNSGLRWAAYRQWTAWVHGHLGRKIRIPIPSCVVTKIREMYPIAADESHVGFHQADSDLDNEGDTDTE